MRTWNVHCLCRRMLELALLIAFAGPSGAQPYIDGDYPGFTLETGLEQTVSGNPLDSGDRVYSLRASYRPTSGKVAFEGLLGVAEPTSAFARSLGLEADLRLVDLSVAWYLNYPPKIDRSCGGKSVGPQEVQPWHCGQRVKPQYIVFGGPGWATLTVDNAFPTSPLPDASKDFFTLNAGFAVKLRWLKDAPSDLAPGLQYDARRTSRWYLRPEIRARWFDGGNGDVDWGVGLALGYNFSQRMTDGALCLQIQETCHLATRVLEHAGDDSDQHFQTLQDRRAQLQEYRARAVAAGVDCGPCLDQGIQTLNDALDSSRRPHPGSTGAELR